MLLAYAASATLPNWSGSVPLPATPGVPSWNSDLPSLSKAVTVCPVKSSTKTRVVGALPLVQGELQVSTATVRATSTARSSCALRRRAAPTARRSAR